MTLLSMIRHRFVILKKEKLKWLALFTMPIILSLFTGAFFNQTFDQAAVPIAVVDHDHSEYSRFVIQEVSTNNAIRILEFDEEHALKQLAQNKVDSVFVLPSNFKDKVIELDLEGLVEVHRTPISVSSGIVRELFASAVTRLSTNVMAADKVVAAYEDRGIPIESTWKDAWDYTDSQWEPAPLMTISYHVEAVSTESNKSDIGFEQKQLNRYGFLFFSIMMLFMLAASDWFIEDRESFRWKRMKVYQVKNLNYILGNLFPYFITFLSSVGMMAVILWQVLGITFPVAVAPVVIAFIGASLTIGLWLSTLVKTKGQLFISAIIIMFPAILLEGAFQWLNGHALLEAILWMVPLHWMLEVLSNSLTKPLPLKELIIIFVMGALFLQLAVKRISV